MIKGRFASKDGDVFVVGLSDDNITALVKGNTLRIRREELGSETNLLLFYGPTEKEMWERISPHIHQSRQASLPEKIYLEESQK